MEFKKKLLKRVVKRKVMTVKTYSEKPQNIVMTESQLERLIKN